MKSKNEDYCLTNYIYYFLLNNIEVLQRKFKGVGLKHISKENVKNIKIPIPPIEKQKEIIKYFEDVEKRKMELERKIEQLKQEIENINAKVF
jgi:type I restriction enzyme S subunit